MLLEKLEQNRHALMLIGEKAILRGRELGLTPSCADPGARSETDIDGAGAAAADDDVSIAKVMTR